MIAEKEYVGRSVDIFALGVLLFKLYFGKAPFVEANPDRVKDTNGNVVCASYKFLQTRPNTFWRLFARGFPEEIDEDFKCLI